MNKIERQCTSHMKQQLEHYKDCVSCSMHLQGTPHEPSFKVHSTESSHEEHTRQLTPQTSPRVYHMSHAHTQTLQPSLRNACF